MRTPVVWTALLATALVPVAIAATSPFLQYRDAIYIAAGFAGILALALLLFQPLLAANLLPGPAPGESRRWHRGLGLLLVVLVVAHVGGLWLTSPPDVVDVLLFRSPTPFSVWGALAMWAALAAAIVAASRRRLGPRTWRALHLALASLLVVGTVVHAVQIQGAMETVSKWVLCVAVLAAALLGLAARRRRLR